MIKRTPCIRCFISLLVIIFCSLNILFLPDICCAKEVTNEYGGNKWGDLQWQKYKNFLFDSEANNTSIFFEDFSKNVCSGFTEEVYDSIYTKQFPESAMVYATLKQYVASVQDIFNSKKYIGTAINIDYNNTNYSNGVDLMFAITKNTSLQILSLNNAKDISYINEQFSVKSEKRTNEFNIIQKLNKAWGDKGLNPPSLEHMIFSVDFLISVAVFSQQFEVSNIINGDTTTTIITTNNKTFNITDWTINSSNGTSSSNWLSGVSDAIDSWNTKKNFVKNVILGFSIFLSMIILIINITQLALNGDNPYKRRNAQVNFLVSIVCISLLGMIDLLTYLLIDLFSL